MGANPVGGVCPPGPPLNKDRFDDGGFVYDPPPAKWAAGLPVTVTFNICSDYARIRDAAGGRYQQNNPDRLVYVNGFFDWNGDGDFDDPGEHTVSVGKALDRIFRNGSQLPVIPPVTSCAPFEHEFIAAGPAPPWIRWRLDYGENLTINNPLPLFGSDPAAPVPFAARAQGIVQFGEVEDYIIERSARWFFTPFRAGIYVVAATLLDGTTKTVFEGIAVAGQTLSGPLPKGTVSYVYIDQDVVITETNLGVITGSPGLLSPVNLGTGLFSLIGLQDFSAPLLSNDTVNLFVGVDLAEWLRNPTICNGGEVFGFVDGKSPALPGFIVGTSKVNFSPEKGWVTENPLTGPASVIGCKDGAALRESEPFRFTGLAHGVERGENRGGLRITERFTLDGASDLSTSVVTIDRLLNEVGGAGELVDGLPITLSASPSSNTNSAIYETPAGVFPRLRMTIAKRGGNQFNFRLDGVDATIDSPLQCPTTNLTTTFTIDDGINPPQAVTTERPWRCFKRGDKFEYLRTP